MTFALHLTLHYVLQRAHTINARLNNPFIPVRYPPGILDTQPGLLRALTSLSPFPTGIGTFTKIRKEQGTMKTGQKEHESMLSRKMSERKVKRKLGRKRLSRKMDTRVKLRFFVMISLYSLRIVHRIILLS
jgi:hypothetical protein